MKIILNIVLFISLSTLSIAQEHITWSAKYDLDAQKVILTANLDEGWHVYSQTTDEFTGPVATKFELEENDFLTIESPMIEPKPISAFDPNFESNVRYFEKEVHFEQKIIAAESTHANYTITYMICNESMCFPPVDEIITLAINK